MSQEYPRKAETESLPSGAGIPLKKEFPQLFASNFCCLSGNKNN